MYMRAMMICTQHKFVPMCSYQNDNLVTCETFPHDIRFSPGFLEDSGRDMPYKDPAIQREYLRNWRQKLKLSQSTRPLYKMPTGHVVTELRRTILPAIIQTSVPLVDQTALKTSPDGALQTGRTAVQAYQVYRGQLSTSRTSAKRPETHWPPAPLPQLTSRHIVLPIASILVEVLFRLFA
jgi:hypothetical protein